jgi:hypothetical protein
LVIVDASVASSHRNVGWGMTAGAQVWSLVVVPATLTSSAGPQGVQAVHALRLLVVLKSPEAQAVQLRSLLALPAVLTYVPASQSLQAVQLPALVPVLNVLPVHAVHVRLLVALPAESTRLPGAQTAQLVQLVALALLKVPFSQASHVSVLSALLKLPAAHGKQLRLLVLEPWLST